MAAKEKVDKVFSGCLDNLPDMDLTSVSIFFSSTFTDMSVERNHIMKYAVPKLREYCFMKGLDLQIVDMRWGVRSEASVDHSTTDIVLQQIDVAQKTSKGPNFVAFLGDRYGSRYPPKHIEATEFKLLRRLALRLKYDVNLLDKWFLRNENAIPTEFQLRPITDIYPHYNDEDPKNENLSQQEQDEWDATQNKLLKILRAAADDAYNENLISKDARQKYFYSVTEAEVERGILKYDLYKDKVLCYNRAFHDINIEDKKAGRFIDLKDGKIDDEAAELRTRLKVAKVFPLLGPDQLKKDNLYWTPEGIDVSDEQHILYLENLASDFQKKITKMVDQAYDSGKDTRHGNEMFKEILHHLHFVRRLVKTFCGQEELLEEIRSRLMVYHGEVMPSKDEIKGDNLENMNNQPSNGVVDSVLESEKRYWVEQKSLKEHLKSLGVVYCHGDEDFDVESDPNRNLKAEMLKLPDIKHYSRPLILYGESGSGKTAVMAKVASLIGHWFPGSVSVVRFFGTSQSASLIKTTLLGICTQIRFLYNLPVSVAVDLESDFDYLYKYFLALLWKIDTESKPLCILLDSVDQLMPDDYAHFLHWLPLKLPPNVHFLVSMLPEVNHCLDNVKKLMPLADQYLEVPQLPMNTADNIISQKLQHDHRRLTKLQRRYLLECFNNCCRPLYLNLLIDQTANWTSSTTVTDLDLGKDLNGAIQKIFDQLERKHGTVVIERLCGYLGAAKEGLSIAELEDILSLDDEVLQDTYIYHLPPDPEHIRLPSSIKMQILHDIYKYIVNQSSGEINVINWYHLQFKIAAEERYLKPSNRRGLHKCLAEYFMGTWHDKVKPLELYKRKKGSYPNNTRIVPAQPLMYCNISELPVYNLRKLAELPYHLTKAKMFDEFRREIACNFDFLLAKCRTSSVITLIKDLHLAITEMDEDGIIDQKDIYQDIHSVCDSLLFGCSQILKDPNFLATLLTAQFGTDKADCQNSTQIKKLIRDAQKWCQENSIPLLVPEFRCLPSPGGILQGSITVDTFLRGEERNFSHSLALNWEKKYLYVIHPVSRSAVDYLKVFDLHNQGACIITQQLMNKVTWLELLHNRYLHMTDGNGVDHMYDSTPENQVKLSHEQQLMTVSKSGKYLAYSTVGQPTVYVCEIRDNMSTFKEVQTMSGYEGELIHLIISPDDQMLVGTFKDFRVVWSVESGQELYKFEDITGDAFSTRSCTFITKDNILICGANASKWLRVTKNLQAINLKTGEKMYEVKHDGEYDYFLTFVSLHGSEKYFATGPSGSGIVDGILEKYWKICDIQSGEKVTQGDTEGLYNPVYGTEHLQLFGKDFLFVAVALHGNRNDDCSIIIGYAGTVKEPLRKPYPFRYLQGHNDMVLQLLISPDETCMFSTAKDNNIKIWNLEKLVDEFKVDFLDKDGKVDTGKLQQKHQELLQANVTSTCMKICRNSQYCFIGTSNGRLVVYNLGQDKEEMSVQLYNNEPVKHMLVSSTNKYVIVSPASKTITIWNIETGQTVRELEFKPRISCMDEKNNILIVGSAGMEAKGSIWNIETGELLNEPKLLYSFYEVAINPEGTKFVSSMFDLPIIVPVSPNSEEEMMLNMEKMDSTSFSAPTNIQFSSDGTLASSGSADGALRIVTDKGKYIFRMQQKSTMTCAAFSVDSKYVVTGGYRSIYVWSIADGSLKYKLRNHTDFITSIRFDRSGNFMLTTSLDKKIVLWDFNRGYSLASFTAYCQLENLDFSPNGQIVVYSPGNVGLISVLKPNPVLKEILEGKYFNSVSSTLQEAQAMALSFSSQKVKQKTQNSHACEIM